MQNTQDQTPEQLELQKKKLEFQMSVMIAESIGVLVGNWPAHVQANAHVAALVALCKQAGIKPCVVGDAFRAACENNALPWFGTLHAAPDAAPVVCP